jgi:hypothetical protein
MKTLLVLLALSAAGAASAQGDTTRTINDIRIEERLRIEYMRGDLPVSTAGRFMIIRNDTLVFQIGPNQHSIAITDIQTVQVPGRTRSRPRWALGGAAIGAVVGYGLAAIDRELYEGPDPEPTVPKDYPTSRRITVMTGVALLGGAIGASLPGVEWYKIRIR